MTVITPERKTAASAAGITLILMAIAAGVSYGGIHGSLVVEGDATATWENIRSSLPLFRMELLGWLVILISDIVVAWAFYIFMRPWNEALSLLGAWLRLIYAAILGAALLPLIHVLLLADGTVTLASPASLPDQIMLCLKSFEYLWFLGLVVFGGHLLVVGWVAYQSGRVPKVISILLLVAAVGYFAIHLGQLLLPPDNGVVPLVERIFQLPMIAGELGFGIWLLVQPFLNPAK